MTKVDQFESVFRSAVKDRYLYEKIPFASVLTVTDLEPDEAVAFQQRTAHLLKGLETGSALSHKLVSKDEYQTPEELLSIVAETKPDLICAYRNLNGRAWRFSKSLGEHLDVLLQQTDAPVLVMPHPEAQGTLDHAFEDLRTVLAVTDHLTRDHRLINYAVAFTEKDGLLFLAHIEDQGNFDRIVDAIAKIPDFDTEELEMKLKTQLLKEPSEFIESCQGVLTGKKIPLRVESIVAFGHFLSEYRAYILEHQIDLLVMNLKEDDQLAMHGLAYPLAIELREIPILIL